MRNLIFGGIGLFWGGSMLLGTFLQLISGKFNLGANGAYAAGQMFGVVFSVLMFSAGLYYFVKGWKQSYGSTARR